MFYFPNLIPNVISTIVSSTIQLLYRQQKKYLLENWSCSFFYQSDIMITIVPFVADHASDFQFSVYCCNATDLASAVVLRINSLISFVEKEENRATGLFLHGRYGQVKEKTCLYLNERFFVSGSLRQHHCDYGYLDSIGLPVQLCRSVKAITRTRKNWVEQDAHEIGKREREGKREGGGKTRMTMYELHTIAS